MLTEDESVYSFFTPWQAHMLMMKEFQRTAIMRNEFLPRSRQILLFVLADKEAAMPQARWAFCRFYRFAGDTWLCDSSFVFAFEKMSGRLGPSGTGARLACHDGAAIWHGVSCRREE